MVGIGGEQPLADGAGHRIEVVAVVTGCGGDDVIAAGDQDQVIVPRPDGDVQVAPSLRSPRGEGDLMREGEGFV